MILPGLSFDEYRALPGFNASLLKVADSRSLAHAKAYIDGLPSPNSDALDFGSSFHNLLLRGVEDFVVRPDTYPAPEKHAKVKAGECKPGDPLPWNGNAGACKDWLSENAKGKLVHDAESAASLRGMVTALRAHPEIAPHLNGQCELAVTAERKGLQYKALVDLLPDDPSAPVIDFKSCRSCNPRRFVADAVKLGYHLQSALYVDVLAWNEIQRKEFWFVAVEDAPPYVIWIMKMRDEPLRILRVGRARYRAAVQKLVAAESADLWPGYESVEPEDLAPAYLKDELEQTA